MPRNSRRVRSGGGNRIRPVDWEGAQIVASLPPNSIFGFWVVEPDFINQNLTDPTLMATRWQGTWVSGSASDGFFTWGLIAWNFVDPLVVPTDLPDPISNSDYDWIARGVGAKFSGAGLQLFSHDGDSGGGAISQARRRLGNDSSILFVAATDLFVSATFILDVRCLLKE